jgi:prepilin-type N-terminal cleavage/methylation domain-containing protein
MRPGLPTNRGFSLIELIVVTVILGIMAAILSPMLQSSLTAYDKTLGDVVVLDKLRYATERIAREIRGVQYASSTTTTPTNCGESTPTTDHYCIFVMDPTRLQFRRSYTDAAGIPTLRTVTIGSTSSTVTLAYSDINAGTPQVLTDELAAAGNLAFTYYRQDGTTTATLAQNSTCTITPTCVGYIEVNLTLTHNGNPYTQRTRIGLRTPPL